ncbi:hypothetical protein EJ06DRAFT_522817 [Trichodelitschia bisporula]|uniref:Uncharacterized protein n=1 Tax=Trichodelitschia bisporula TaxID=703511 RepID=A0A6G1HTT6_9PEZI|nr:hypothetical protein EJ06DRAFT_522817 [Trichodelitschia bisporula]
MSELYLPFVATMQELAAFCFAEHEEKVHLRRLEWLRNPEARVWCHWSLIFKSLIFRSLIFRSPILALNTPKHLDTMVSLNERLHECFRTSGCYTDFGFVLLIGDALPQEAKEPLQRILNEFQFYDHKLLSSFSQNLHASVLSQQLSYQATAKIHRILGQFHRGTLFSPVTALQVLLIFRTSPDNLQRAISTSNTALGSIQEALDALETEIARIAAEEPLRDVVQELSKMALLPR